MKLKKLSVLLICMFVLLSLVFTGCGKNTSEDPKGTEAESTVSTNDKDASKDENAGPDELTILGKHSADYNNYSKKSDYTDWPILKEIERLTNTKITWELYQSDIYETTIQTILATGSNLPDIIWDVKGADNLLLNDITIDLAPYIKGGKAPNLKKIFIEYPEAASFHAMDDGRITSVPYSIWAVKDNVYVYAMNKLWLDKVNRPLPATIDELTDLLRLFKETDLNGNGKKDEIPFMTRNFNWFKFFGHSFGIKSNVDDWYFYADDDKKVYATVLTEEYKNYISWIYTLYEEKLVNRSALETSDAVNDIVAALTHETEPFVGGILWNSYTVMPSWNSANFGPFVNLPLPKGPGVSKVEASAISASMGYMVVTKASKNPDAAVRYIDFNYSEEGIALSGYGILDDTYKIVDGKKVMTDKLKSNTTANPDWYMPEGYGMKIWGTVYECGIHGDKYQGGQKHHMQIMMLSKVCTQQNLSSGRASE